MKWNDRIKVAREALGINKAEFARRAGVSTATTADWESGKIKMIAGDHLVRVAQILKVTPEWIVTGMGTRAQDSEAHSIMAEFAWLYHHTTEEGRVFLCNAVKAAGKAFVKDERRLSSLPVAIERRKS